MPIDWVLYAWKAAPFASGEAKKWWNKDAAKSLNRRVEQTINSRDSWPSGVRAELIAQWLAVRDDRFLSSLIRELLDDPDPAREPLVRARLNELLNDLPLILGTEETAERLSAVVLDQLGPAQKNPEERAHADTRRVQRTVEAQASAVDSRFDKLDSSTEAIDAAILSSAESVAAKLERIESHLAANTVLVAATSWAPKLLGGLLEALAKEAPVDYRRFVDMLGDPPQQDRAPSTAAAPPPWLLSANPLAVRALAVLCEHGGAWLAAADAWELVADVDVDTAVDSYVHAGVAAKVGGDGGRYLALMERARRLDPTHPSVLLEDIPDDLPPGQRLRRLEGLSSTDAGTEALIRSHRITALVLSGDPDGARRLLEAAPADERDTVAWRASALNVAIHQGRLDRLSGSPLRTAELQRTATDALLLRDELLATSRWEEAASLLMIASDAYALLDEIQQAKDVLHRATELEFGEPRSAEVLASCALRLSDPGFAKELTERAPRTPAIDRIRAIATIEARDKEGLAEALRYLDHAVAEGGAGATEAALFRAIASAAIDAEWSAEAEARLRAEGHERPAVVARAEAYVARGEFEAAYKVLDPHQASMWAKTARLRVARRHGDRTAISRAASDLLDAGPSHDVEVEVGRALAACRQFRDAQRVVIRVARDPNVPTEIRSRAFHLLMSVVGTDQGDWDLAQKLHEEWSAATPSDPRLPPWAPHIACKIRQNSPES